MFIQNILPISQSFKTEYTEHTDTQNIHSSWEFLKRTLHFDYKKISLDAYFWIKFLKKKIFSMIFQY